MDWQPVRTFARDAAVQATGTLGAAAVIGLAATLSGVLSYDAAFTGKVVALVLTAAGAWPVMNLSDRQPSWWRSLLVWVVGLVAVLLAAVLIGAGVTVGTRPLE